MAAISITDHDTVAGIEPALEASRGFPLEFIPGIELSTVLDSREIHLLGYFIDPGARCLQETLTLLVESRIERARKIISKLGDIGLPLSWEKILSTCRDSDAIGRPHIARALVAEGYVRSTSEAFELFLSRGAPAYVPRYKLSPFAALKLIFEAGGLPVLAHPLEITDVVPLLAERGLVGLEVFYRGYTFGQISELLSLANRFSLVPTGGTDFHGDDQDDAVPMGSVYVPPDTVEKLHARLPA